MTELETFWRVVQAIQDALPAQADIRAVDISDDGSLVTIWTSTPGWILGRRGATATQIREALRHAVNPELELRIEEVKGPPEVPFGTGRAPTGPFRAEPQAMSRVRVGRIGLHGWRGFWYRRVVRFPVVFYPLAWFNNSVPGTRGHLDRLLHPREMRRGHLVPMARAARGGGAWDAGEVFERFTDRARRVLVLAQEEARLLNHSFLGTEHILLGLIHEGEGVAATALEQLDITLEAVRQRVEETIGLSGTAPTGSPPFTPRAKKVLELSLREALQLGHNYIGTEHILLGLVREGEGVAAQVLVSLGADLARVRQQVIQLLAGYQGTAGAAGVRSGPMAHAPTGQIVACSFCGRRPPDAGRLVTSGTAFICEHCVQDWANRLAEAKGEEAGASPQAKLYEPPEETAGDDEPQNDD